MSALVRVTVPAPDDVLRDYAAGALIRLERATSEDGVYAEIATKPVVDDVFSYELFDATGSSTHWYRVRYSNAGNTVQSEYGAAFSPSEPVAYGTLDDILLAMKQPTSDTRFWAAAERHLQDTATELDREIGYSARVGSSQTWIVHGRGGNRLHLHGGVVSLDQVEIRTEIGGAWTVLEGEGVGWYLEGAPGIAATGDGEPFFHLVLVGNQNYTTFPTFPQSIRLTGVPGWPAIRPDWRAANVAWARQRLAAANLLPGGQLGPDELGGPSVGDRWPRAVYDLVESERHRFWCHL